MAGTLCTRPQGEFPRRTYDMVQIRMSWYPSQHLLQLRRTGAQYGRIAVASFHKGNRNPLPTYLLRRIEHLFYRVTVASANVEDRHSRLPKKSQCPYVRVGDVEHVDIVAETRAIWGWIVGSEDLNGRNFSRCSLQYTGNKVGFRLMTLTHSICRTARVEIAQCCHSPAIGSCVPRKNALEHELAFAIGGDRLGRMIF